MVEDLTPDAYRHVHELLRESTEARITGVLCLVEDVWTVLASVITVLHEGMPRPRPFELEEAGFVAFEKYASQEDIQSFLASVSRGRPTLPASCRTGQLSGSVVPTSLNLKKREYAARDFGLDWPCVHIDMHGGGISAHDMQARFHRFLQRLPAKQPPFLGSSSLAKRLGVLGDLRIDSGTTLSIRRPLPLRIRRVSITSGHKVLAVEVEAHGHGQDGFALSSCPNSALSQDGITIQQGAFQRGRAQDGVFTAELDITSRGPVTLSLFTDDAQWGTVDSLVAGLPHMPFVVHDHYDKGCQMLRQLLFGLGDEPRNDPNDFAAGVSWLLHMLGFASMSLGLRSSKKNLTHSPDVIARSPDGQAIIVGECSVAAPTDGKVDKLVSRSHSVESALRAAGIVGARVVPVFFSATSGGQEHGSARIVQRHDLEDLLRLAESGGDPTSALLLPPEGDAWRHSI